MMLHPQACIDIAAIGHGTRVWQFASVIRGAKIGENCNIASCAIVDGAVIGDGCSIGHGASVHPGVRLGNGVFVGPGVVFCNDGWPRTSKEGFEIDRLLSGTFTTTEVADKASIGAGAVVLPGVVIGEGVMIAAGAVVDRNVPDMHLFKRDGSICAITMGIIPRRMREASR